MTLVKAQRLDIQYLSVVKSSAQIVGILNLTQDSFFDGGKYFQIDQAFERAMQMIDEGVDIIDVGAESSRPFADKIDPDKENKIIQKIVQEIRKQSNIPISIDTTRARTAENALRLGANIINDISALQFDPNMIEVIKNFKCPIILMHMRGNPKTMQLNTSYDDLIKEVQVFFEERIQFALSHGIDKDQIILDPGIGFGKSTAGNLELLKFIDQLKDDFPILIGASRKSFIGEILDCRVEDRLIGSLAVAAYSFFKNVRYIRVHDVHETSEMMKILQAIEQPKEGALA